MTRSCSELADSRFASGAGIDRLAAPRKGGLFSESGISASGRRRSPATGVIEFNPLIDALTGANCLRAVGSASPGSRTSREFICWSGDLETNIAYKVRLSLDLRGLSAAELDPERFTRRLADVRRQRPEFQVRAQVGRFYPEIITIATISRHFRSDS